MGIYFNPGDKRHIKVICAIGYAFSEVIGLGCGIILAVLLRNCQMSSMLVGALCVLTTMYTAGMGCMFFWGINEAAHVFSGNMNLGIHIAMTILFGSVWVGIWTGRTTGWLNKKSGMGVSAPVGQMLLCLFVPCYIIYWFYRQGRRCDHAFQLVHKDAGGKAIMYMIMSIFFPVVPAIIMQCQINSIETQEASLCC